MHYYKKNIGDYAKKAGRLTMLQHGAYTLLIDACYDRERFPTMDEAIEWSWASTAQEVEAVQFVLRKFFTLEDGVYVQSRIKEEIDKYHQVAEINKRIAAERETNRKEKRTKRVASVDDSPRGDNEAPPNQEPLTKNQEPLKNYPAPNGAEATPRESLPNLDDLPDGLSYHDALFQVAVPWMVANGTKESNARSLLGGAEKRLGPEGAWALASECMDKKPLEPAVWLAAALNARIKRPKNNPYESEKDRSRREAFEKLTGRRKDDPLTIEI